MRKLLVLGAILMMVVACKSKDSKKGDIITAVNGDIKSKFGPQSAMCQLGASDMIGTEVELNCNGDKASDADNQKAVMDALTRECKDIKAVELDGATVRFPDRTMTSTVKGDCKDWTPQ